MELVEGPTLADLIANGTPGSQGIPIADALAIARQIAEALEAAHDQGIETSPVFKVGTETELFELGSIGPSPNSRHYDVAKDGRGRPSFTGRAPGSETRRGRNAARKARRG